MIAVGVDGLSRGLLNEGVMGGADMLSFIPFDRSALQLSMPLEEWIQSWLGKEAISLSPEDWFERGHDIVGWQDPEPGFYLPLPVLQKGKYIWSPPPGAADVAIEEMRKARMKRQASTHVFVCQRLMTPRWLRQLHKAADLVFHIPAGQPFWSLSNHEPLVVGIILPFFRHQPWQLRGTPKMFAVARELSKVWEDPTLDSRPVLRKLCELSGRLDSVPVSVVPKLLLLPGQP
jgi:hypothetical protein